jgi:curved DNA-binding protein CbpA
MPRASTNVGDSSCLYEVLQVSPRAKAEVIHAAYRVLVRDYHPDVSQAANADEHMRRLNAAHEILTDPERRAHYDASLAQSSHRAAVWREAARTRGYARASDVTPHTPMSPRPGGALVLVYLVTAGVAVCAMVALLILLWSLLDAADGPSFGSFQASNGPANIVTAAPIVAPSGGTTGSAGRAGSSDSCVVGWLGSFRTC